MTLIVGAYCSDGLVVGADGAATFGNISQQTAQQPTRKLEIVEGRVVVGVSGPVGLGQLIRDRVADLWKQKKLSGATPASAMRLLRDALWQDVNPAINAAAVARNAYGPPAVASAVCSTLVALPVAKEPCLIHLDQQCAPERATTDLPFISVGSGQAIADPFLAFLRHVFWPQKVPTVVEGVFAVTWTLDHAIRTNTGGVADPIQIVVMKRDGGEYLPRELKTEELDEHRQNISAAEQYLAAFPKQLTSTAETAQPPQPP